MTTRSDSFDQHAEITIDDKTYAISSLETTALRRFKGIDRLPKSLKVLLENLLRNEDGQSVTAAHIEAVATSAGRGRDQEVLFRPARVLMQDFTGVPAIVDLAAMRAALVERGLSPEKINPSIPVDLVIDHSVSIDKFASEQAFEWNVKREFERNYERYEFLKWGQQSFDNFQVVPPGTGICHQVNLEYLAKVVYDKNGSGVAELYPDTLVGTDSHTTMINSLGVLGWGVGGIEAEAAMLGQPISMLIPEVVGFEFAGELQQGVTATDLVLRVVEMLREHGVVGKFVEFFGDSLELLTVADRATIANMAPEYGATCGFFAVDQQTIEYLRLTGRDEVRLQAVETYCKHQGLWRSSGESAPDFASTLTLDLATVVPSVAGPKRPQDRISLGDLKGSMTDFIASKSSKKDIVPEVPRTSTDVRHGDVVIAAITSCTNTSNPTVMVAAGLIAKRARELGIERKPWVKTSLAPGSKVVTDYLEKSGLQTSLDELGFNLVGYGCTTCIGNSGPLPEEVAESIKQNELVVSGVLSGNRNFEGRIHQLVQANWLASPPLVVAYAIAGTTCIDIQNDQIAEDRDGNPVYLKDLWPSSVDIQNIVSTITEDMFEQGYQSVFDGDETWNAIQTTKSMSYDFSEDSTYIRCPSFFQDRSPSSDWSIKGARVLALLGDSVTTDHISPAGNIAENSAAATYLRERGVDKSEFNSYGSRRGNHEVMMRGTFANIRIQNELVPGKTGGFSRKYNSDEVKSIFAVASEYMAENTPTIVVAGKEYGTGSSRDWAAKGTLLLGVKAVITESYERIHRSNLIGMGVLPLQFPSGVSRQTLKLNGSESYDILVPASGPKANQDIEMTITRADGAQESVALVCRIDTDMEAAYYRAGGILNYVLEQLAE